ncbi:MAG: substrate-binding domain-containing protein [Planctomycetia bacterium]|nr:substrate-binding domain-containing protein [Planctomycetia bacterium]
MIQFPKDLPRYGAADLLKSTMIEYIVQNHLRPGDPFFSDLQIAEASGRSRSTVRRALDQLQDEKWIRRKGGVGTFVGSQAGSSRRGSLKTTSEIPKDQKTLRIGLISSGIGKQSVGDSELRDQKENLAPPGWFSSGIILGLEELSIQENYIVEYMGSCSNKPERVLRRFEQSKPDVLINMGHPVHAAIIEAQRNGIPVIFALNRDFQYGTVSIYEDNAGAMDQAVALLRRNGHERIGFLQIFCSGWWAANRYSAYLNAMDKQAREPDESLALLIPEDLYMHSGEIIARWLRREKPTAVICGSCHVMGSLKEAAQKEKRKVPDDLSIITYDQAPMLNYIFEGINPHVIELPTHTVGIEIGKMVRRIADQKPVKREEYIIPCNLIPGNSIVQLKTL